MASKIRKNDNVLVLSGKDKGKRGLVQKVFPRENKAIVQNIAMSKHHEKQSAKSQGGIVEKETKIHLSNLAVIEAKTDKPTRIGFAFLKDGRKVRRAKASGENLDV